MISGRGGHRPASFWVRCWRARERLAVLGWLLDAGLLGKTLEALLGRVTSPLSRDSIFRWASELRFCGAGHAKSKSSNQFRSLKGADSGHWDLAWHRVRSCEGKRCELGLSGVHRRLACSASAVRGQVRPLCRRSFPAEFPNNCCAGIDRLLVDQAV